MEIAYKLIPSAIFWNIFINFGDFVKIVDQMAWPWFQVAFRMSFFAKEGISLSFTNFYYGARWYKIS